MASEEKSKYSKLYKTLGNSDELQENRRKFLLNEQKRLRSEAQDNGRDLEEFVKKIRHRRRTYKQKYDEEHKLQLSEWLRERPDDVSQWFVVPCPKGQRCLVIASGGFTEMYSKSGRYVRKFHTGLPGDGTARHQVSILDCVFVESESKFFVLDMMAYGNHDLVDCETQFRFFWISSKLAEADTSSRREFDFVPLQYYDLGDQATAASCFESYPQFLDNTPELDGFLFYHKDASYTYGTTPLVGWLFGFMVPEVLGFEVHPAYMTTKPDNYIDYLHYMTCFDEALHKRNLKKDRTRLLGGKMDEDLPPEEDENEMDAIIHREQTLEMEDLVV